MKYLVLLGCLVLPIALWAASHDRMEQRSRAAINDIFEQRYDRALAHADTFLRENDKASAWSLRSLVYHSRIIDYESNEYLPSFVTACDSGEYYANALIQSDPARGWFTLGTIAGFRAAIQIHNEQWVASARSAMTMRDALQKALTLDSSYVDAFVALGSYEYWSSQKMRYLPFYGDKRAEGIAKIHRASRESRINPSGAIAALVWIEIDRKRYDEALRLAESQLKLYPSARSYLWAAGEAAYLKCDWQLGITYYLRILTSVRNDPGQTNQYNELGCYHRLTEMYMKLSDVSTALSYANKGLSLTISDEVRARKQHDLSDLKRWQSELNGKK